MLDSPVDQIKTRLDIIEVISSYIRLQKAGRNYKARCPFHKERTPSFMVSPERQIWHCFGCSLGGDIFSFVMQIEGIEFADALRILAGRAGVVLKKQDPKIQSQRKRLYEICELSAKFFTKQLWESKNGKRALEYLKKRGMKEQTMKGWRLGWAPDTWHALSDFLRKRGFKDEEIFQAGLTVQKEQKGVAEQSSASNNREASLCSASLLQNYHDRFRNRIMFPIFDISGQIIGFGGRVFPDSDKVAKYLNTPQGLIYDKSRVIYGLNEAKLAIKKQNQAVVVEGYTDALMSHQAGVKEAVASSGTAFTDWQLRILKRYTDNLLLAFDMDLAGDTATKRTIEMAQGVGFNVRVIELSKKDPADLIKEEPSTWPQAIKKSVPIMDFYFRNTFAKFDCQKVEGKKEIGKVLLPIIAKLSNKIEQAHWLQELSQRLKTGEDDLREQMKKTKIITDLPESLDRGLAKSPVAKKNHCQQVEERLAAIFLTHPQYFQNIKEKDLSLISDRGLKNMLRSCYKNFKKGKATKPTSKNINHLFFLLEQDPLEEKDFLTEINNCLKQLHCSKIKESLADITWRMKEAEKKQDNRRLAELLNDFNKLSKKLNY